MSSRIVNVTHIAHADIGNDRSVTVQRAEDGSYQIEWTTPDLDNGHVHISSRVVLSAEAVRATMLCVLEIADKRHAEHGKGESV